VEDMKFNLLIKKVYLGYKDQTIKRIKLNWFEDKNELTNVGG
jgi:hypothetical protein